MPIINQGIGRAEDILAEISVFPPLYLCKLFCTAENDLFFRAFFLNLPQELLCKDREHGFKFLRRSQKEVVISAL